LLVPNLAYSVTNLLTATVSGLVALTDAIIHMQCVW
jgi:hypothetical protein